jgi:hypothetical protein
LDASIQFGPNRVRVGVGWAGVAAAAVAEGDFEAECWQFGLTDWFGSCWLVWLIVLSAVESLVVAAAGVCCLHLLTRAVAVVPAAMGSRCWLHVGVGVAAAHAAARVLEAALANGRLLLAVGGCSTAAAWPNWQMAVTFVVAAGAAAAANQTTDVSAREEDIWLLAEALHRRSLQSSHEMDAAEPAVAALGVAAVVELAAIATELAVVAGELEHAGAVGAVEAAGVVGELGHVLAAGLAVAVAVAVRASWRSRWTSKKAVMPLAAQLAVVVIARLGSAAVELLAVVDWSLGAVPALFACVRIALRDRGRFGRFGVAEHS